MGNIATELILSAKEQLDKAIASATSKITLLENLLAQGLGEEQLKQVIEEKINDGTIGNAIFNQENIVNTKNVTNNAITNDKIDTTVNNLATNITNGKTIVKPFPSKNQIFYFFCTFQRFLLFFR